MTKKDVLAGNKLLAQFETKEPEVLKRDLKKAGTVESMEYHSCWLWLMPVIEKIASMYHKTEIVSDEESDFCRITVYDDEGKMEKEIFEAGLSTKEASFKAAVQFVKWFNKKG